MRPAVVCADLYVAVRGVLRHKKIILCVGALALTVPALLRWSRGGRRRVAVGDQSVAAKGAVESAPRSPCARCGQRAQGDLAAPNSCDYFIRQGLKNLNSATHLWKAMCVHLKQSLDASPADRLFLIEHLQTAINMSNDASRCISQALLNGSGAILSSCVACSVDSGNNSAMFFECRNRPMSIYSDDSFYSAVADIDDWNKAEYEKVSESLDSDQTTSLLLYNEAMVLVEAGMVLCRKLRTSQLHCKSDEDFLAKLHCIRKSTQVLFQDLKKCQWLRDAMKNIVCCMLKLASADVQPFQKVFDELIDYATDVENQPALLEELKTSGVPIITLFDVASEIIIFDAVDDIRNPPSALISVLRNPILPSSTKRHVLGVMVNSVISSKQERLKADQTFMKLLCDVLKSVAATFAWSLFGTDTVLNDACKIFMDQLLAIHVDLFDDGVVRYTNETELADDVWKVLRGRMEIVGKTLNNQNPVLQNLSIDFR